MRKEELEQLLGAVLDALGPQLSEAQFELVADFVATCEYDTAYDWLVSTIEDEALVVSDDVAERLDQVAALMGGPDHSAATPPASKPSGA